MTITLNNQPISLSDICLTEDGAIFACGSETDWSYMPRELRDAYHGEKYHPICANCGASAR